LSFSPSDDNSSNKRNPLVVELDLRYELKISGAVNRFDVDLRYNNIRLELNGQYHNATIVCDIIPTKWSKIADDFKKAMESKGVNAEHIKHILNTFDANNQKITDEFFASAAKDGGGTSNRKGRNGHGGDCGSRSGGSKGEEDEESSTAPVEEALTAVEAKANNKAPSCDCAGSKVGIINLDPIVHLPGCRIRKKIRSKRFAVNTSVVPADYDGGYTLGVATN
jgi:hypothetical protein